MNPHKVTADFEQALSDYLGAPHVVVVNSCTNALWLSLMLLKSRGELPDVIECPRFTYVGVPMHIMHAGCKIRWTDEDWQSDGFYQLTPTPIVDSARLFTSQGYLSGEIACYSFHWSKHLATSQAGAIAVDNADDADRLRLMRYDGRSAVTGDVLVPGWHCYLSPEVAAQGLVKLHFLPAHNEPLPESNYVDCSQLPVFAGVTV